MAGLRSDGRRRRYAAAGLGRKLVALALKRARERHATSVAIEVYAHNVAALELYRSAGFVSTGPPVIEERSDGQRWEALPLAKISPEGLAAEGFQRDLFRRPFGSFLQIGEQAESASKFTRLPLSVTIAHPQLTESSGTS